MTTRLALLTLVSALSLPPSVWPQAVTTIDPTNHFAYAANVGWVDGYGNGTNGAVIGEYVCSGYLYGANVGWINLGSGFPPGGVYYSNTTAANWGVNQDGQGNLRGFAWGANIGWVNFEYTGAPKVDLATGHLSGYAWSANCGWISLSNTVAHVQTDTLAAGADADRNRLPDAWELIFFGHIGVDPTADPDNDGLSNKQEYLAGTHPLDGNDRLRITSFQRGSPMVPSRISMNWTANASRMYAIQLRNAFDTNSWSDFVVLSSLGANNAAWNDYSSQRFYRVRAFRPLMP